METKVEPSGQVVRFVARPAPEPRRQLHTALRALVNERGDIRALRIGSYRIIFAYRISGKRRVI